MKVTSKGQVTIPIEVREKLGIRPNSEVQFEIRGNAARLTKVPAKRARGKVAEALKRLKGSGDVKMSTDEILALMRGSDDEVSPRR
jgi:AbrB family looped-hinge helix DNA binding protein